MKLLCSLLTLSIRFKFISAKPSQQSGEIFAVHLLLLRKLRKSIKNMFFYYHIKQKHTARTDFCL